MLKQFTAEGRFECGMNDLVHNKVWCFVAVLGENFGARLGIAVANEPGYHPIPEFWAYADHLEDMQRHADELNRAEGCDQGQAIAIQASTMGGRPLALAEQGRGQP